MNLLLKGMTQLHGVTSAFPCGVPTGRGEVIGWEDEELGEGGRGGLSRDRY